MRNEIIDKGRGTLCVKLSGASAKTRTYVVAEGFGPDHGLGVYNNNTATIERALIERYFLCKEGDTFRPALNVRTDAYRSGALTLFRELVMQHMPHLPVMTEEQVVNCYTGTKHRVYKRAHLSLQRKGLCEKDSHLTSFVKFEKQDVQKAPRVINPRNPRYNLTLGKYLKHSEKHFYRAINAAYGQHTSATVVKGFNATVSAEILRAKWDRFSDPVAVGLDASKFDMHVSVPALRYEHSFYKSLFPDSTELCTLLSQQEYNRGCAYAADGKVKFGITGTRSSGDLNTSLGNCIIMCSLVFAYAHERNIPLELANNGDDCVVFMERHNLERFSQDLDSWFRSQGFAMTVEKPCHRFEEVEFCQTHPVHTPQGWRMVRNHHAVLTKDPMCLVPIPNDSTYRKWLYAVGECGMNATFGVPVQYEFYKALWRLGTPCTAGFKETIFRNTGWAQRVNGLQATDAPITDTSRVSYYSAFGVLPDVQCMLEDYYRNATIAQLQEQVMDRSDFRVQSGLSLLLYPQYLT